MEDAVKQVRCWCCYIKNVLQVFTDHNPVTLIKRGVCTWTSFPRLWPDSLSTDKSQLLTAKNRRQGEKKQYKGL